MIVYEIRSRAFRGSIFMNPTHEITDSTQLNPRLGELVDPISNPNHTQFNFPPHISISEQQLSCNKNNAPNCKNVFACRYSILSHTYIYARCIFADLSFQTHDLTQPTENSGVRFSKKNLMTILWS